MGEHLQLVQQAVVDLVQVLVPLRVLAVAWQEGQQRTVCSHQRIICAPKLRMQS